MAKKKKTTPRPKKKVEPKKKVSTKKETVKKTVSRSTKKVEPKKSKFVIPPVYNKITKIKLYWGNEITIASTLPNYENNLNIEVIVGFEIYKDSIKDMLGYPNTNQLEIDTEYHVAEMKNKFHELLNKYADAHGVTTRDILNSSPYDKPKVGLFEKTPSYYNLVIDYLYEHNKHSFKGDSIKISEHKKGDKLIEDFIINGGAVYIYDVIPFIYTNDEGKSGIKKLNLIKNMFPDSDFISEIDTIIDSVEDKEILVIVFYQSISDEL